MAPSVESSSKDGLLSFCLASLTFVALILLLIKLQNATGHPAYVLEDRRSSIFRRYSEVYRPLKVKATFLGLNYFSWFLFRRLLVVGVLLFLHSWPLVQLMIHLLLAVIEVWILVSRRPFIGKCDNFFSLCNGLFILGIYCFLLFSYFSEEEAETLESYGWVMIIVVIGYNGLAMLLIFLIKVCEICKKCKKLKANKKLQI